MTEPTVPYRSEHSERLLGAGGREQPQPGAPDAAIEAVGLTKSFGGAVAVDGVDLSIPSGTVFGLLGPNGAGKTTTVRMLATLLRPDAGTATVVGHDLVRHPDRVRRAVSLTGQYASVDEELTGRENLTLLGRLYGLRWRHARQRADELLDAFGLGEASGRLARTYSGGMRRRLDIASSLVVTPSLLFLDEPTTGLDPRSRNQVWEIVRMLVGVGTTVLLTTQHLDEADQLAARIAIIDRGRKIAEGTPAELKASVGSATLHVRLLDATRRPHAAELIGAVVGSTVTLEADPAALTAAVGSETDAAGRALSGLADAGMAVASFALGQPSLDEVFLALTGHRATTQTETETESETESGSEAGATGETATSTATATATESGQEHAA